MTLDELKDIKNIKPRTMISYGVLNLCQNAAEMKDHLDAMFRVAGRYIAVVPSEPEAVENWRIAFKLMSGQKSPMGEALGRGYYEPQSIREELGRIVLTWDL